MEETARSRRPPVPPRRSTRPNFGVAPNFYGDPVMGWRRQTAQRQEASSAPLSSTNPFINDINEHEDDRHSTASSSTRRRQQELELQRIKFQIELNETKMEQMKLYCKQTDLQMEMLNEVEDGEILSDEEIGSYEASIEDEDDKRQTIDDWFTTEKTVEFSAIPITDKDNPHYVPTPKPRKGITKNTNPFAAFPPQPPITTATTEPPPTVITKPMEKCKVEEKPTDEKNGIDTLAAALVQALTAQGRTTEKFVARQSDVSKLPIFGGNPLDWPIFINHYKQSTVDCGFSAAQNMSRLEKSIKGEARKTVQALMIVPTNTDEVIKRLEMRYGRPEYIIQALVDLAKKTPSPKEGKLSTVVDFANSISNLVTTIGALKTPAHLQNPQLIKELVDKLPDNMKLQWGEVSIELGIVTLEDLSRWINKKATAASLVTIPKFTATKKTDKPDENVHATTDETSKKCVYCNDDGHYITSCARYRGMDLDQQWNELKKKKLCVCCLAMGHRAAVCRKKRKCGVDSCSRTHHKLLHGSPPSTPPPANQESSANRESSSPPINNQQYNGNINQQSRSVLLRVVPVKLYGPGGEVKINALLDEASTVTLLSAELAEKLKLTGPTDPLRMRWTNAQSQLDTSSRKVSVTISGANGGNKYRMANVRTVRDLKLPAQPINYERLTDEWPHLKAVSLENIDDETPMILIGQPHIHLTVAREVIDGGEDNPMLTRTRLGWIVHGPLGGCNADDFTLSCFHDTDEDLLHNLMKETFQLESIGIRTIDGKLRSRDDLQAEKIMDNITRRDGTKWETGLLWREENTKLPTSYDVALRRLNGVERRFERDNNLELQYKQKINHYFLNGYARILSEEEAAIPTDKQWFLPHFPTTHPNKPGKIRIVFDAASKSHGISLNDNLLTGPDLLTSLPGVLLKFRQKRVAFTGDITEMFHQVKIRTGDCAAQRFLWRDNRQGEPKICQLEVMMFGSVCSPYCAQYVKNRNVREFEDEYPAAASAIVDKHYMDDYLDSCDTVVEANQLIQDVTEVHRRGGFEIGKWISNSQELMKRIAPATDPEIKKEDKNISEWSEIATERVLGLHWEPSSDSFTYRVNLVRAGDGIASGAKHPTKREILRLVMLIFDPLGFLNNYTVKARIILQHIWRTKIGWDDEVPMEIFKRWKKWLRDLPKISDVRIPRCYSYYCSFSREVQLHVFADASEAAYAAVAFLRTNTADGIDVNIVMSKARVAPLKPTSIPRLELQAALTASRLGKFIISTLEVKIHSSYFWSDSQTVLKWIRSDAKRFQQFVANRIGEIHETTDISQWSWIPTKLNVADDATREGSTNLAQNSRWIHGPEFLKEDASEWPKEKVDCEEVEESELELRREFVAATVEVPAIPAPDFERFSKYGKLVRVTALMLKFIDILKAQCSGVNFKKHLTPSDMKKAERLLCRKCQWESFPEEMDLLSRGMSLSRKSKLYTLSPCIDEYGVLVMNSRLEKADTIGLRQPIILDSKHPLTKLIINFYHEMFNHQGQELVKNEVRQRFWIPTLRAAIRRAWSECGICKIKRAKPLPPLMGNLPQCRIQPQPRAFTIVGMDYFGPMEVTIGRRHEKRYGVLFTCMTTRAVHLEIAHSLSTDSCIMAIRRLIGRRGMPTEMHSDNGTNLRGADKELRKALEDLDQDAINGEMTKRGIVWNFIPPSAPHMGGSWERLIKSVKTTMAIVLKTQFPREEVLQTVFVEAESIVNSRPLTDVPVEAESPEALTPMHFLIGTSSVIQPPGIFGERDLILSKRWRQAQRMADLFWKRWLREYLPTLQRRTKWHAYVTPIKVGDIVIVMDESLRRGNWPLGRVMETFPGRDGAVRVAEVKTGNGVYRRPVAKLAKLDIKTEDEIPN